MTLLGKVCETDETNDGLKNIWTGRTELREEAPQGSQGKKKRTI